MMGTMNHAKRFITDVCDARQRQHVSRADRQAFADLLKKHKQPVGLMASLKESVGQRQKVRVKKKSR
jgi:hypothetical protein